MLRFVIVLLLSFAVHPCAAQGFTWPDDPENLQVLEDADGARLRAVMTGFSRALGVRCTHCHEGEDGAPLSGIDFAGDANPNKDRAREMLRMLESINGHLERIEPSGDRRVNMWCHTCHDGRPRPMTLAEELTERVRVEDARAAVAHYETLKRDFMGKGAYDFGEAGLNAAGYAALGAGDVDGAIALFEKNVEEHPESANVYDSLGEAVLASGDTERAVALYRRALELNPRNANAAAKLEELGEQ